ncbi:unnamed protein product [Didymodactylos carnosus]|uniref:Nuclear receptor domain-containing protein n=1 Tax=Didymodactylos carnosus TaxID=1234261 RepID=A0A814M0U1_9BILA|nr:unnamed protein product [Didymodactylos carnosus]CAF1071089.1 unnamed protein product [Didymodactylos carnosus]CAF3668312.1 unnamed protein product [Didymodactylos carnosus]CAF3838216.1 unnamed protein product [Didymodactylos carnosus]
MKVVIITDDETILDQLDLNSTRNNNNVETLVVDLSSNVNGNIMELALLSKLSGQNETEGHIYKQLLNLPKKDDTSSTYGQIQNINYSTVSSDTRPATTTARKRKADLTCVVCGGGAFGYNFEAITCESCKAFFRRNALQPLKQIKCIGSMPRKCNISNEITQKCKRCRLEQCFAVGMRKDYILTNEEKLFKKKRIEDNRCLRQIQSNDSNNHEGQQEINFQVKSIELPGQSSQVIDDMNINIQPSNSSNNSLLSTQEWSLLCQLQASHVIASQFTVIQYQPAQLTDKMSALIQTTDIQKFVALKLINYLKSIEEFEQLDENDRLTLVKYNLPCLFMLHATLTFDIVQELFIEPDIDEQYAQDCKDLFIYYYGLEFHQRVVKIIGLIIDLTARDPIIVELLLVIMIFTKGLSVYNTYSVEPILTNSFQVYQAQCTYTSLLWRYMLQKYDLSLTIHKFSLLITQIMKIQEFIRDFQQFIVNQVDVDKINPLMKSLWQIT